MLLSLCTNAIFVSKSNDKQEFAYMYVYERLIKNL